MHIYADFGINMRQYLKSQWQYYWHYFQLHSSKGRLSGQYLKLLGTGCMSFPNTLLFVSYWGLQYRL